MAADPELDVVTMAVKVPETLAHLHYWSVQMTRQASKDEVLDAFRTSRTPNSVAHNRQETPLFAKSIERHALARH